MASAKRIPPKPVEDIIELRLSPQEASAVMHKLRGIGITGAGGRVWKALQSLGVTERADDDDWH